MKTQLEKPARIKASYTDEYKQQALELWRASGRSAAHVAAELGIRDSLHRCIRLRSIHYPQIRPDLFAIEQTRLRRSASKLASFL
jgi:transposase-like protein